jgi:hypothetical protein
MAPLRPTKKGNTMKSFACALAALALIICGGCGSQQTNPNAPNPNQGLHTANKPVTPEVAGSNNANGGPSAANSTDRNTMPRTTPATPPASPAPNK